ncbi:hypothetical protein KJ951_01145 [Patescibacteria group bacterium]|nr:hypothetical protein [Patescibacteria group bacterium]MBU1702986.1 hypothetical protein [Patescibacteria group bacterium]MBU1953605.1 hypothetical protein [Patescibacteria group bacterium]
MVPTDSIREFLQKNKFYVYKEETSKISDNYLKEYLDVTVSSNKRNIYLSQNWEDINSFGKPRRIIVLDLGGTKLNIFDVKVIDDKTIKVERLSSTSFYEKKVYTPTILFHDLKAKLDKFLGNPAKKGTIENLVFIFSHPLEQTINEYGHIDAICTKFVKEHKSEGIVGLKIGKAFQDYLNGNGYPKICVSVTNDTTIHALAAKAYEIVNDQKFDAAMNIIVGTGCNVSTAYNEKEIASLKGLRVINTEFGDFKSMKLSNFEEEFEKKAASPGEHINEKMISGAYQHEIFKIIIKNLIKEGILHKEILNNLNLEKLDSGDIERLIKGKRLNKDQQTYLGLIWREIYKRGGAICGIFLAAVMSELHRKLKKTKIRIIVMETGSIIQKNIGFKESLRETLDRELIRLEKKDKITYNFRVLPHQAAYGATIFDTFSFTQS